MLEKKEKKEEWLVRKNERKVGPWEVAEGAGSDNSTDDKRKGGPLEANGYIWPVMEGWDCLDARKILTLFG